MHVLGGGRGRAAAAARRAAWPARPTAGRARGGPSPGRRLDAVAHGGVEFVRLVLKPRGQAFAQRLQRLGDAGQRAGEAVGGFGQVRERSGTGRLREGRGAGSPAALRAGEHLAAEEAQKRLGRVGTAGVEAAQLGAVFGRRRDQPGAGRARAACSAASSGVSRCGRAATSSSSRRPGRAPATGRPRRRAASGAVRRSRCRTAGAKTRIGGVEDVVALVEHVAGRHGVVVQRRPRRAWAITSAWLAITRSAVRARRMVCSTKQRRQCGQAAWMHSPRRSARAAIARRRTVRQPAGQVAALDVAVGGGQRPAGDQAERDDRGGMKPAAAPPTASSRLSRQR